ncbi:hypothetical protein GW17_00004106 [Ensete ventricosum]|nr:hypothetical protein GW17_00004106 [Ensete ventricosum]
MGETRRRRGRARRRLVFPCGDEGESSPRLSVWERGRGSPRLLAQGRGNASFTRWKTRRRLLFQLGDEAPPSFSREARRGYASRRGRRRRGRKIPGVLFARTICRPRDPSPMSGFFSPCGEKKSLPTWGEGTRMTNLFSVPISSKFDLFFDPNPSYGLHTKASPIDPSLSTNQLAHQLLELFSKPPKLRDAEELQRLGRSLVPATAEAVIKGLRSWRTAHEFFRWASWQHGFRHTCYTYNAMAYVFSRARRAAQLKGLAAEVLKDRCPMTPGALGFLIRCLGDQGLVEDALLVFDRAVDLHCFPNSYTYNCLLEVLANAGLVEAAESRFKEMVNTRGLEPDKYTLTSMLQLYCKAGKLADVWDIFDRIKLEGWADEHVLTVLIVTFCKWGKVNQVCELVDHMEGLGMMPTEKTFSVLVHGLVRQGRLDKALQMFDKMKRLGYCGDLALHSVIIEGLFEGKEFGLAHDMYMEMKKIGISPDVLLLKKMIMASCRERDFLSAGQLLDEGVGLNLGSLISLYNVVLDGLIEHGEVDRAYKLLCEMMKSKGLQVLKLDNDDHDRCETETDVKEFFRMKNPVCPNADSFNIVICGLCDAKKLDAALVLLNNMIGVGYKGKLLMYNNLIHELCNVDRLEESYELLRKMEENGFMPTAFTYNSIFYCTCRRGDLSAALDLLKEMRKHGHLPWIKHCTLMVQQLCGNGKVAEAAAFLDDMVALGFLPDMVAYSAAIDGLCKSGDVDKGLKLFRDISSRWYLPDVVAHNILINGFCKTGRLPEALEIFEEMLKKELVPSPVTYNLLIDGWCKAKNIDNALACFKKMVDADRPPTIVTYTSIIDGLCDAGRSDDALMVYNEMRGKGCAPNQMTYTALIHGLCKCGRADVALVYFDEMKQKEFELDTFVYLLLINSLIMKGNSVKALELLKGVLQRDSFYYDSKNSRLMKKAVSKLFMDESTSSDVRLLIESGHISSIQSLHDMGQM